MAKMMKNFEMCGHKLTAIQLDNDSVRRCVCVLDDEHNLAYLISYYTVVAIYDMKREKLYRTWTGWSRTTARHVSLFADYLYKECSAKFSYFSWKEASTKIEDYGKCLPLDWLVRKTREYIKLDDKRVAWGW